VNRSVLLGYFLLFLFFLLIAVAINNPAALKEIEDALLKMGEGLGRIARS